MAEDHDQSKEFEPTQRKLDESRKRGDLPRSVDLTSATAMIGMLLTLWYLGPSSVDALGQTLSQLLIEAAQPWGQSARGISPQLDVAKEISIAVLPVFAAPAGLVLLLILATKGIVFAPERLQPKLEKINPIKNARQKFGLAGWVEFFKSALKLTAVVTLVAAFMNATIATFVGTARLEIVESLPLISQTVGTFLAISVGISLTIGLFDLVWQRLRYHARLRMTRQEMKQETRESEGDGHLKQRRRQRGYDIATNRMLLDVPKADVVLVNPTHFAVALKWDRNDGAAPRCVAKGVDDVAARIREIAELSGVPIHRDPVTARALHAAVEIGQQIRPDHYRAVAAAIRFAEAMRKKAKGRA